MFVCILLRDVFMVSGRRDVEFAGVFASVAFLAVSVVPEFYFGTVSPKLKKEAPSKTKLSLPKV